MSLSQPYCTPGQVQQLMELSFLDPTVAATAINRASRAIDEYTGRDFWFHDYTETAYAIPPFMVAGELILLPFEIITLTEVADDSEVLVQGSDEDYTYVVGRNAIRCNYEPLPHDLTIKGTFGYPLATTSPTTTPPPTLPPAVSTAAMTIAAVYTGMWRKSVNNALSGGIESFVVHEVPRHIWTSLNRYKVTGVYVGM